MKAIVSTLSTFNLLNALNTSPMGVFSEGDRTYPLWMNFLWYQTIWFVAVLGGETAVPVVGLMLLLHLIWAPNRNSELWFMTIVAGIGITIDSIVTLVGIMQFAENSGPLPIPLWLTCIWLAFAGTLRHSMNFVMARPSLAIVLGLIFAPLTYIAGERLGAVEFSYSITHTALVLGMCWACLMVLFTEIWSCFHQADEP
ncbi:MAG: DUF2878 domain-containing protein [Pseudomonadota bacterium]